MAEIRRLGPEEQVQIIGILGDLRADQFRDSADPERFGKLRRGKKTLYRVRIGDLRFYFEFTDDGVTCRHILQKHSFEDFCFRCGFSASDDGRAENGDHLWRFLEERDDKHDGHNSEESEL
ncbi:MAG: hypothetical protein LBC42_03155 [Puniceicoccales bacterium]|nr:hypothetical protein [Puniceicoccales bacterium]